MKTRVFLKYFVRACSLALPCMTKVHAVDFHYLLFLSRDKLWQLLEDPTDFISSTFIHGDRTIGQD